MKLLGSETIQGSGPALSAREVLETIPLIMRVIRSEMRRHRMPGLSVPQFRTLALLRRQAGSSLSQSAEHIGLTLPAMSQLVDGLVARGLVLRRASAADRRRVTLTLTPAGRRVLAEARRHTQAALASLLTRVGPAERETVVRAMRILRGAAAPDQATSVRSRRVSA